MCSSKGRELRKRVERALREEGARDFSHAYTGTSHQRLYFTVDGFKGYFSFASTPGGKREIQNACAAARRKVRSIREKGLTASESLDSVAPRWRAEPGSNLAKLRAEAHRALDVHWEFGQVSRSDAYAWLSRRLGIPKDLCHIGMFGEKECERAIALCRSESP